MLLLLRSLCHRAAAVCLSICMSRAVLYGNDYPQTFSPFDSVAILHCESKKLDPFLFEHNFRKYCPIWF